MNIDLKRVLRKEIPDIFIVTEGTRHTSFSVKNVKHSKYSEEMSGGVK